MSEEWRFIPGFEPYEASSLGKIRRAGRLLAGSFDADGYPRISTSIGGRRKLVPTHTLVALAFVGPRPTPKHTVAHGDGTKTNNAISNLRWALMPEQYADRRRHGTDVSGERHPQAKLTQAQADEIRTTYRPRDKVFGARVLARKFGVTRGAIDAIINKGGWSADRKPRTRRKQDHRLSLSRQSGAEA